MRTLLPCPPVATRRTLAWEGGLDVAVSAGRPAAILRHRLDAHSRVVVVERLEPRRAAGAVRGPEHPARRRRMDRERPNLRAELTRWFGRGEVGHRASNAPGVRRGLERPGESARTP